MADLSGILGAATGGGLFGVLGQVANRAFTVWETREKRKDAIIANAQQEKLWVHETNLLQIQMQQAQEAHEQELETASVAGSWEGLRASIEAESRVPSSYKWVDAVRAMVRPFLTIESQIAVIVIFFAATGAERASIQEQVVETVTFIATAAALWWFGERAEHKTRARG